MIQIVKEIDIQIQAALEPQAAQLVVNLSTTYSRQDFENKAGEVVLSALEEDLSSVPITHIWRHTLHITAAQGVQCLWPPRARAVTDMDPRRDMHII